MMASKESIGKCLMAPVVLSRLAVLIALPVPAQLTSIRSCPIAARALTKPASTLASSVVHFAEDAAKFRCKGGSFRIIEIEDCNLCPGCGERARRRFTQSARSPGNDRRLFGYVHCIAPRAAKRLVWLHYDTPDSRIVLDPHEVDGRTLPSEDLRVGMSIVIDESSIILVK